MPGRRRAVIIPDMPSLTPALCFIAALALACPAVHAAQVQGPDAHAADLQPRAYPWLMSRATLVLAGTVENVSGGLFGAGRTATIRVDGLIKGRWNRRDIQVSWNDKDFEETGYRRDARVVVFGVMRKDSTFAQASPGISCWPVEKVEIKGKPARAVEYAYPLDLLSGVPTGVLKTTESVEQSKNFRMAQRKQWILIDHLLPPVRPFVLPKPPPPRKPAAERGAAKRGAAKRGAAERGAAKRAAKPARKHGKPASAR
jgi:hypothetical protein